MYTIWKGFKILLIQKQICFKCEVLYVSAGNNNANFEIS